MFRFLVKNVSPHNKYKFFWTRAQAGPSPECQEGSTKPTRATVRCLCSSLAEFVYLVHLPNAVVKSKFKSSFFLIHYRFSPWMHTVRNSNLRFFLSTIGVPPWMYMRQDCSRKFLELAQHCFSRMFSKSSTPFLQDSPEWYLSKFRLELQFRRKGTLVVQNWAID